ncbi:MAG TPA: hypothetical protein ENJ31_09370 [Anaerolineae bacterium]|nr:hypothetical protein [Anaerolineae bacterium]
MRFIGLILLALAGLAGLTTLYRYADLEAAAAARFASALTALRLHDAELNRDLLRLRHGDLPHYDSVNAAIRAIAADLAVLTAHAGALAPQVAALQRLAAHKRERLEDFKAAHALVRNSLAYTLHRQEALARRQPQIAALSAALLQFLRYPDPARRNRVRAALARVPDPSLARHVELILDRLPRLEATLSDLLANPLGPTAARLAAIHQDALARLQKRAEAFRLGLFLAAAGFLTYLLYALARLARANRRLREEMRQRLAAERQLLQAQKMEALGALASGIAHDFNNLLSGIRGYTVLAREQLQAGQTPDTALGRIDTIVGRGQELIGRLLQFARPGSGKVDVLAPAAVVEEALSFVRPSLPSAVHLDFVNHLPPDFTLAGRPGELQQVVINLVRNAADAVAGDGHITVTLEPAADGIRLQVRDDGRGIDPAHLPTLFDPFASGKPAGLGTGLGLAIVQRIVAGHGGRIEVSSQPGRGTTFTLHLPAQPLQR